MGNNKPLQAHLSLLSAEIFWGLLAPIGKDAMLHGVDNITLVSFRVTGAALLFWIASLFVKERMPWRHVLLWRVRHCSAWSSTSVSTPLG